MADDLIKRDTVEYDDPTPFDNTKLQSISEISKALRHKMHGEDVREPIAQQGEALVKLIQETGGNQSAEVQAARGNFELLGTREDAQEKAINKINAKADTKFDADKAESYLKSITVLPETYTNLNALKTVYPNGKNGLFVTADNGHKYIWNGKEWQDAGIYQSEGIADNAVTWQKMTRIGTSALGIAGGGDGQGIIYDKAANTITIPSGSVIKNGLDYYEIKTDTVLSVSPHVAALNGSSVFAIYYDINASELIVQKYQYAPTENSIWIGAGRNTTLGTLQSIFPVQYTNAPILTNELDSINRAFNRYSDDVFKHGYFQGQAINKVLIPHFLGTNNRLIPAAGLIPNSDNFIMVSTTEKISIAIYFYDKDKLQLTDSGWINGRWKKVVQPDSAIGFTFMIKNDDDSFVNINYQDIFISSATNPLDNLIDDLVNNAMMTELRNNQIKAMETTLDCSLKMQELIKTVTGSVSAVDEINNVKIVNAATVSYVFPMVENAYFEWEFQWRPSANGVNQAVEIEFNNKPTEQYNGALDAYKQTIGLDGSTPKLHRYRLLSPLGTTEVKLTFTGPTGAGLYSVLNQLKVRIRYHIDDKSIIKWIPHRGCAYVAPENTMPAFINAQKLGFDYIEADLAETGDGNWLITHDYDISRCSNGSGSVTAQAISWAKQFDYGSKFDSRFSGTTIPDVEEIVRFAKTTGIKPILEFKNGQAGHPVQRVIDLLSLYDLYEQVIFNSFDFLTLQSLDSLLKSKPIVLGYLTSTITQENIDQISSLNRPGTFINCNYTGLTTDAVKLAHDNNIPVYTWTIDKITDAISAINMGVDAIISDHLNLAGCIF